MPRGLTVASLNKSKSLVSAVFPTKIFTSYESVIMLNESNETMFEYYKQIFLLLRS